MGRRGNSIYLNHHRARLESGKGGGQGSGNFLLIEEKGRGKERRELISY